ncbi:MAG: hypothetical protein LZF60_50040 [Nitrospira sp.]|nr:MAG: hypothetical protein LZF60_50040 [Nitrospira sp.]
MLDQFRIVSAPAPVRDHIRHDIILRSIHDGHRLLQRHEPAGQFRRMQMRPAEQHSAPLTERLADMLQSLDRALAMRAGIFRPPGHRDFQHTHPHRLERAQRDPVTLLRRLLRETEGQIDTDDVATLGKKSVQNAPALAPKRKLSMIGKPGEQSKERNADPGRPIHRMIGTTWPAPLMFYLCVGHGQTGQPL